MRISQLELWSVVEEKVLNLKRTAICTNKCNSKPISFLSDDITHLNQLYLFGHVARASHRG